MSAHASHSMHENSLATFREEDSKLSKRERQIVKWLEDHGDATDRQVMVGLGYSDMNAVRPRITELVKAGVLAERCTVRCPVTRKPVRKVGFAPVQKALFQ